MADLASRRSIHKAPDALGGKQSGSYWIALPTCENTLLAFDPIRRIVPTTITRITANITAYSAMSCPCSSFQSCCKRFATGSSFLASFDRALFGPRHYGPILNSLTHGSFKLWSVRVILVFAICTANGTEVPPNSTFSRTPLRQCSSAARPDSPQTARVPAGSRPPTCQKYC